GPGFRIRRPVKIAVLRLTGLKATTGADEVAAAVVLAGGCMQEVSSGDESVSRWGTGTAVMRCPLAAAAKAVAAERVQVGWTRARVVALPARTKLCYRCLERGHVRERCDSAIDRSGLCYRCGNPRHRAKGC
ncbi:hypothetical protein EAI_04116, partial [Harpegnathos saltator]